MYFILVLEHFSEYTILDQYISSICTLKILIYSCLHRLLLRSHLFLSLIVVLLSMIKEKSLAVFNIIYLPIVVCIFTISYIQLDVNFFIFLLEIHWVSWNWGFVLKWFLRIIGCYLFECCLSLSILLSSFFFGVTISWLLFHTFHFFESVLHSG